MRQRESPPGDMPGGLLWFEGAGCCPASGTDPNPQDRLVPGSFPAVLAGGIALQGYGRTNPAEAAGLAGLSVTDAGWRRLNRMC